MSALKTLRVLLTAPWHAALAQPWVLFEGVAPIATGNDAAAAWPPHDVLELVVSGTRVRLTPLVLPPMPAARLLSAARFAVEDQIAAAEGAVHVAVGSQDAAGRLLAAVCPREIVDSVRERSGPLQRLARVIAEPELCAPGAAWRWCRCTAHEDGFVRVPDGAAFATSPTGTGQALPGELTIALSTSNSAAVQVEWPVPEDVLARWARETGIAFRRGDGWVWSAAGPRPDAIDLAPAAASTRATARRGLVARVLAPALVILAAALALHVLALGGTWLAARVALARADGEWRALAVAAGLPESERGGPDAIRAALRQQHEDLLHRQHRFSRFDALPLMARAAPVLATLPRDAVKRAVYGDAHWTFELQGVPATEAAALETRFRDAGLAALVVPVQGGSVRVRAGMP